MKKRINAQSSKCWDCKYGVCSRETEQELVQVPVEKDEGVFNDSYRDDEPEMVLDVIEHERVKAVCYWRPEGIEDSPPILMSFVKECSRYEQE